MNFCTVDRNRKRAEIFRVKYSMRRGHSITMHDRGWLGGVWHDTS